MAQRPSSMGILAKKAFSLIGGILLEVVFFLGTVVLILAVSAAALLLWQLVG